MEGTISEIRLFAGNFAPMTWAFCQGQIMSIAQNTALFSLLGTTFGGDGQTTFALPDFRGRVAVGTGQGSSLPNIILGEIGGTGTNTLTVNQLPAHNHIVNANNAAPGRSSIPQPAGNFPAQNQDGSGNYASTADTTMNQNVIGMTGGTQPVNNLQPFLGMNYIICLEGIYPSRN